MAHAIGTIASTINNEDGGVNERLRSMKETLAQITRAMQEMVTMNQGLNGNGRNQNQNQFTRMKKVEFLKFSRDDVKGWIFRCEQFFSIDEIPENQKSSSKEYQVAFDTLLSKVDVSKEHAVSFYLGGLPTEIEMWVRMFKHKTLVDAYQLINLQEATLEAIKKKNKALLSSQNRRFGSGSNSYESNAKSSRLPLPTPNSSWRTKPNTPTILLADEELECEEEYMEKEISMPNESAKNGIHVQEQENDNKGYSQSWQNKEEVMDSELSKVLDTFEDVFVVPAKLPPQRSYDHKIPLLPNTQPINIRPYRHPPMQKDAIEVIVKELLYYLATKNFTDHVQHLSIVLITIGKNKLFAKKSKCAFGTSHMEYLGYVISAKGVATNPSKIKAMQEWLIPSNVKQLIGFLGLTDYYRRFIMDFALAFHHYDRSLQLKHLLDQRITTPTQMKWFPKLMGFDYEVVYKKGSENGAANALLREASQTICKGVFGLPKLQGKNVIFVVVDRLSKYANFIALSHPFTAHQVAQAFLDNVYKLHGMPESIVSDREKASDCEDGKQHKFSPKYYGPFKVISKVRQVAYELELNSQAQIHNVFHVYLLKGYKGEVPSGQLIDIPLCDQNDILVAKPLTILDQKMVKKKNALAVYGDMDSLILVIMLGAIVFVVELHVSKFLCLQRLTHSTTSSPYVGLQISILAVVHLKGNPPSFEDLLQIAPLKGLAADFDGSHLSIGNRMLQNGPDSDAFQRYYNLCVLNVTPTLEGPLFDFQRSPSGRAKSVAQSVFLNMIFLSRC
nr:putative mitochondrial protein [Tanacetum cinerariifolium]